MRLHYILFVFLLVPVIVMAQQVKVLNAVSEEPIAGVLIYNKDKSNSVITNLDGIAELDRFSSNDILYFQHLTHILKKLENLK